MMTRQVLELELSPPSGRKLPINLAEGISSALGRMGIRTTSTLDGHGRLLVQLLNVDDDECRYAIQTIRGAGYQIAVTVEGGSSTEPQGREITECECP